ncbi:MAG: amino acid ABC transporter permease [Ensifer adhaerens]|nr:amino acid ABC transporter permease [Ensifer adhaerens]
MSQIELAPPVAPDWHRWREGLFSGWANGLVTLATLAAILWIALPFVRWAVIDAVWTGTAADCATETAGACWAFVGAKFRFMLFAFFPPPLQWRPALVIALIAALLTISALPRFWSFRLVPVWLLALVGIWLLMAGAAGLEPVSTNHWGGLPITLTVSIAGLAFAFPIALALALARQSDMGLVRSLAIAFIEVLRGVPMIAVLYVAMLIVPMALPSGAAIDKLLRAQIGVTLFFSAYLAEIIRAGLQVIPAGQKEAALSLGLSRIQMLRLVVLPQALRAVIPAIVNLSIGIVLNTSLLAVIGIYDLLNAAKTSATDPAWLGFYSEAYIFAALVYFAICFSGSRYSLWLEKRLNGAHRR